MSGPRSQVGLALGAAVLLSLFVGLLACPSSEEGLGPQDCVDGIDNDGDSFVDDIEATISTNRSRDINSSEVDWNVRGAGFFVLSQTGRGEMSESL